MSILAVRNHSRPRAFTVVELLVVIAIIVVLVAVTFPFVGRTKQRANETKCVSNLRQLGIAMAGYSAENNMGIPPQRENYGESSRSILPEVLRPYTGGGKRLDPIAIWECPSQVIKERADGKMTFGYSGNPVLLADQLDADHGGKNMSSAVRRASVRRPSEVFVLIDAGQRSPGGWATVILNNIGAKKKGKLADANKPWKGKPFTEPDEDLKSGACYRHNGSANTLFLDGHVAKVSKGEILQRNVFIDY